MSAEFKDYYRLLDVPPTATADDIKKAFRTLARKFHPDVAKDKKTAEDKFKEINEANEVLSNPESRSRYDQLCADRKSGADPAQPRTWSSPPTAGPDTDGGRYDFQFEGTGFSDFFEQFFGGRAASTGNNPTNGFNPSDLHAARTLRGQDIQGDILISLNEALTGAMRSISVRRTNSATGAHEPEVCSVRIPPGVQAGQSIRIPAKGGEGVNGGAPGDIFLRVHHAEHPDWHARGCDLIGNLELAPWEAVLGATVATPTLEGSISVKVPSRTQQGHQLRIRNRGLPTAVGERGDLYLAISICLPSSLSSQQEDLWKQLALASTFNPRSPSSQSNPTGTSSSEPKPNPSSL